MLKNKALIMFSVLAFLASGITSATSMPSRAVVQLDIRLYSTKAMVTKACKLPPGSAVGCRIRQGPGRSIIIAVQPKSWCDMNKVETIGHEVLHALGKNHGPNYKPAYVSKGQETGCRNGEWWIRLSPPRL